MTNKTIHAQAADALRAFPETRRLTWRYALFVAGINLIVLLAQVIVYLLTPATGSLSTMNTLAMLDTVQQAVALFAMILLPFLSLGQLSVTLRTARGQTSSSGNLWDGLRLFGPILRFCLLVVLLVFLVVPFATTIGSAALMYLPGGKETVTTLQTIAETPDMVPDTQQSFQLMLSLWPVYAVMLIIFLPISYRLRMAIFLILDGEKKALRAILHSNLMMRRNGWQLFFLDLRQWAYLLAACVPLVLSYGNMMLGITAPWGSWLFSGLSILADTLVIGVFLHRVNTRYAFFYLSKLPTDSIC